MDDSVCKGASKQTLMVGMDLVSGLFVAAAAFAVAVWGGALGCLGLVLRRRWAVPVLIASLVGLVLQDFGMFVLSGTGNLIPAPVYFLQGLVFLIAVGLVLLGRKAAARDWLH